MDISELFEGFQNETIKELIMKHHSVDPEGCIHRAYMEYYSLMINKECTLRRTRIVIY